MVRVRFVCCRWIINAVMNISDNIWSDLTTPPTFGQWCFVQIEYGYVATVTIGQYKNGGFFLNEKELATLGLWKPIVFPEV